MMSLMTSVWSCFLKETDNYRETEVDEESVHEK